MAEQNDAAGIQYCGLSGISLDCQDAVLRMLQFGDRIEQALIISCAGTHGLILSNDNGDKTAIKSGFASGHSGEGPHRFSATLQFLDSHGVEIDECEVEQAVIDRLDLSALTVADLETARPVRPTRWHDYVTQKHHESARNGTLWNAFRSVIPFAIIDSRIIDLAISFWKGPNDTLQTGYGRLEDIIRERTGLAESGAQLISKAFGSETPILLWHGIDHEEKNGRLSLLTGAYEARRIRNAHPKLKVDPDELLSEFLVLNHLYGLEKNADTNKKTAKIN